MNKTEASAYANPVASPEPGPNLFSYGAISAPMCFDRDLAIYCRFGVLNARNLLYLQSELMELERQLQDLDHAANDTTLGNAAWSVPRSWRAAERAGGEY